jgi:twitching motility protein PilT
MNYVLTPFLKAVVDAQGSDLHLKSEAVPKVRINGSLIPMDTPALPADVVEHMIVETMDEKVRKDFYSIGQADYAIHVEGLGRFRTNAFRARGLAGLIARRVADNPMTLAQLQLPAVLSNLALEPHGLVLVTGPTGSGKSTTLAAMLDLVNDRRPVHILTIEDPIEIVHTDKAASINQRELGSDTPDFPAALKAAMRQDPDVILIGEMRDPETVHAALAAAKTGHTVMSTLHTTDAAETINRVIDFFPPSEQTQVRLDMAKSLKGVVCQRLVKHVDGVSRVCVMEVMVNTNRIADAIADPSKTADITDLIKEGHYYGMQTFDQHLEHLVLQGAISVKTAKEASSRPNDLAVALKRAGVDPSIVDAD